MGSVEMHVLNGRGSTDLGTEPIFDLVNDLRLNIVNLLRLIRIRMITSNCEEQSGKVRT